MNVNKNQEELTYELATEELKRLWKRFFLRAGVSRSMELMESLLELREMYNILL